MSGIEAGAARSWYEGGDAPTMPDLRTCIHCGLCLTACPTYRELKIEPDSPRGRIWLMRGLAEGRIGPSDPLVEHLDNCLDCRACETVCPAGVPYGRMLEAARGQIERRARRASPGRLLGGWLLRNVFPHRARMHALGDVLRLAQSPPVTTFMRSPLARLLPRFAVRGWAMTPPVAPRSGRALVGVAASLPRGAVFESRADALVFRPAGTPKARVGFFTSCVMEVLFPGVNREAVRLLVLAGAEVHAPRAQTCCGALHAHSGLREEARALARRNAAAFAAGGYDAVVSDSAGCGAALLESGHLLEDDPAREQAAALSARARDVSAVLAQLGLPRPTARLASAREPGQPLRVGYHDPCHLAHAQGVRNQPRLLLRGLEGVELVTIPDGDHCCGSAGVYNLTHPEMADAQLGHKLDAIARSGAEWVVASNPGCALHMMCGAAGRGTDVRFVHLVELLGRAHPPASG